MAAIKTNFGPIEIGSLVMPPNSSSFWSNVSFYPDKFFSEGGKILQLGTDILRPNYPTKPPSAGVIVPVGTNPVGYPPVSYYRPHGITDDIANEFPYVVFNGIITGVPFQVYLGSSNFTKQNTSHLGAVYKDDITPRRYYLFTMLWPDGTPGLVMMQQVVETGMFTLIEPYYIPTFGQPNPKANSTQAFQIITNWFNRPIPDTPIPPDYSGDTNQTGVGTGDKNNVSDNISIPDITPVDSISISNTKFITIYNPNYQQFINISKFFWSGDVWNKFVQTLPGNNPLNYILNLSILPIVTTPDESVTGKFYYGPAGIIADITDLPDVRIPLHQFIDRDLGSFQVKEYYGNFADYSPYTRYMIYLPYIGVKELDTDAIMNKTLSVKYRIDTLTGNCVAYISADEQVVATYSGCCATSLPVSVDRAGQQLVASGAATAGLAALALAPVAGAALDATLGMPGLFNSATALSGAAGQAAESAGVKFSTNSLKLASASTILAGKSGSSVDGSLGPSQGLINQQAVYLIRRLPRQVWPKDLLSIKGQPSNTSQPIGSYSGFTQFSGFHLEGLVQGDGQIGATTTEINMIAAALQEGVIL